VTYVCSPLTLDLSPQWRQFHREGAPELFPEHLREEIDEVAELVYRDVNNGVYKCGFAGSQGAYDRAYDRLFERLDWLSDRLRRQRSPVGETSTGADARLYTASDRATGVDSRTSPDAMVSPPIYRCPRTRPRSPASRSHTATSPA